MSRDIPEFSLQRMPVYLNYLRTLPDDGTYNYISSGAMAQALGLGEVLVRKDLAYTGCAGRPKVGYPRVELIAAIEKFLRINDKKCAVLVGAGGLGSALLSYGGFENYGIELVCAFDTSPEKIGTYIGGKPVLSMDELNEGCKKYGAVMAIIAVPAPAAQQTAESRRAVAAVIHFLGGKAEAELRPKLDEGTRRELDELALLPDEVPGTIRTAGELDQLWFEFFATGKVEPIRRLVDQLARPGEMLTPKEFKAKKEKGETTPEDLEKLKNFLITLAANWSLNSNAKQHPLVRFYLEAMLTRGEIKHPRSAALVKEILRKASAPAKAGK